MATVLTTARPAPVVKGHVLDQTATPSRTSGHRHAGDPRRQRDDIVERPHAHEQEDCAHEATKAADIMSAESGADKRGEYGHDNERHAQRGPGASSKCADAFGGRRKPQTCDGQPRGTDDDAADYVRGEVASQVHA